MEIARREHTVKRIGTVVAVVVAALAAVPVAGAGNDAAQSKPQITTQVVGVQVAKVQRAQASVAMQRHLVQVSAAKRVSVQRVRAR